VGYDPDDDYRDVFGVNATFDATTLLEALTQGGGGEKALGRHAVAALLNAANPDVSYRYTESEVIGIVQDAYATGDFEGPKDLLEQENELFCPLNGGDGDQDSIIYLPMIRVTHGPPDSRP